MRRTFLQVIASLVVIALVAPAASAAAQSIGQRPASLTSTSPAQPVSISKAISHAVTTTQVTRLAPAASKSKLRFLRAQYGGGGGKGPLIMGIVYGVIGIASTVYMLKYLKDQQNKNAESGGL